MEAFFLNSGGLEPQLESNQEGFVACTLMLRV